MTREELKSKFDALYGEMAVAGNQKYMLLFGTVMKQMMCHIIDTNPEQAERYIETLCAIKWHQYLAKSEAESIVAEMAPPAAWDYDTWHNALQSLSLECERETVFNTYSLWVVMNAVHSDNGKVIAELLGIEPTDVANADYVRAVWRMSLNMLCDEDGKYDVRKYFLE